MNNSNIIECAGDGNYSSSSLRFFIITKDAVSDYPHRARSYFDTTEISLYFSDKAGDNMFASSPISIGEQEACIDTYNDVDFYIFKPNTTRTYTIQTTSDRRREEFNGSTREYDLFIEDINIDDLDCEIYDKYGKLVYYDKKAGQINRDFYLSGGQNYFIKIYNYSKEPCNYKITLS